MHLCPSNDPLLSLWLRWWLGRYKFLHKSSDRPQIGRIDWSALAFPCGFHHKDNASCIRHSYCSHRNNNYVRPTVPQKGWWISWWKCGLFVLKCFKVNQGVNACLFCCEVYIRVPVLSFISKTCYAAKERIVWGTSNSEKLREFIHTKMWNVR